MTLTQLISFGFLQAGTIRSTGTSLSRTAIGPNLNGKYFWALVYNNDVMYLGYSFKPYYFEDRMDYIILPSGYATYRRLHRRISTLGVTNVDIYYLPMSPFIINAARARRQKNIFKGGTLPWDK